MNDMLNLLDIYYDSNEVQALKAAKVAVISGTFTFDINRIMSKYIDAIVNISIGEYKRNINVSIHCQDDLISLFGKESQFSINDKVNSYSNIQKELFCIKANINDKALKVFYEKELSFETLLHAYFIYNEGFFKNNKFSIEIERTTDNNTRKLILQTLRQNKSPEKIAKEYFNPDTTNSNSYYDQIRIAGNKYSRFLGEFKNKLLYSRKKPLIFLLEYFYGLKLNITDTYQIVYEELRKQAYSDFGIRDITKLELLSRNVDVLKRYSKLDKDDINMFCSNMEKIGVKPATNLNRWLKVKQEKNKNEL